MMLGPLSAPSSPPLTPVPTKCSPRSASAAVRRWVSWYRALPPSMTMSPSSSSGTSSSMTASVAGPACTMIRMLRGRCRARTNSSVLVVGTKSPSPPCAAISASVRACVRLCRTTWWPCRARLRARLAPMVARPVTPICEVMAGIVPDPAVPGHRLGRGTSAQAEVPAQLGDVPGGLDVVGSPLDPPLGVDDERRADDPDHLLAVRLLRPERAVGGEHSLVRVGDEGDAELLVLAEAAQLLRGVGGDADDVQACFGQVTRGGGEVDGRRGAAGGQRVRVAVDDDPPAPVVGQRDGPAVG